MLIKHKIYIVFKVKYYYKHLEQYPKVKKEGAK